MSNIDWSNFSTELFTNAELNFDPQAFFMDYMFNGRWIFSRTTLRLNFPRTSKHGLRMRTILTVAVEFQ